MNPIIGIDQVFVKYENNHEGWLKNGPAGILSPMSCVSWETLELKGTFWMSLGEAGTQYDMCRSTMHTRANANNYVCAYTGVCQPKWMRSMITRRPVSYMTHMGSQRGGGEDYQGHVPLSWRQCKITLTLIDDDDGIHATIMEAWLEPVEKFLEMPEIQRAGVGELLWNKNEIATRKREIERKVP